MEKKRIISRHVLTEKVPLIVAALWMIIGQYLPLITVSSAVDPFYDKLSENNFFIDLLFIAMMLFSIILVIIFERWFYPEYKSSLKLDGFLRGMAAAFPVILFIIAYRIFKASVGFEVIHQPTLYSVLQGLRAGINEEAAFRGIAVALLLRQFRKPKNIWVPAVFTGVFFGCSHLLNILAGDDPANVMLIVVFASVFGVIFGIIFTFSGNLWPVVIVHALYDGFVFIAEDMDMPNWPVYLEVALFAVIMILYLIALNRKKDKLSEYWDTRWKNRNPASME